MGNIELPVGTLREARIIKYNANTGKASIRLTNVAQSITNGPEIDISIPASFYSDNGMFIGGLVKENTPIIVSRGEGGTWYFVSYLMGNPNISPKLLQNQLLIQSTAQSKITLDLDNNINIGSDITKSHYFINKIDVNDSIHSSTFSNDFSFTEASRNVDGLIKREVKRINFPDSLKLKSDDFSKRLYTISLDPTASKSSSFINQVKNPPFVEKRELVYEFSTSYNIQDDLSESILYKKEGVSNLNANETSAKTNRRASRADTLSLSLVSPNYLMETIKGTVVDIFGNILDINRNPIPIGTKDLTLKSAEDGSIPENAFENIKALERKSIAFHFEINSRKDLKNNSNIIDSLDIDSSKDYARNRSRFFFDIDKEGQIKANIPSSSETGNIPVLTRYENYSTFGEEENKNPNKLVFRQDNLDILLDSFSTQDIEILSDKTVVLPKDRITEEHIKKGMPFHSITNSLQIFQSDYSSKFLDFQYNTSVDLVNLPSYDYIVSNKINISGSEANAGGRSGSLNMDGSFEWSIGANTIDRQSLWLDLAGGMIANIGRDKNNVSAGWSLDGDLLIQIGGYGISNDSRFQDLNNAYRGGICDIRVLNEGFTVSIIRIDKNGITLATPNTISLKGRDINITAEGNLMLDGDNVSIHGRPVTKYPITSI